MRVISKFRDYYDGAQSYGHDSSLCYVRKAIEVNTEHSILEKLVSALSNCIGLPTVVKRREGDSDYLEYCSTYRHTPVPFVIGFCGEFYFGAEAEIQERDYSRRNVIFYSTDDIYRHVESVSGRARDEYLAYINAGRLGSLSRKGSRSRIEVMNRYFNTNIPRNDDIFFELQSPVFVLRMASRYGEETKIIKNPCLRDYDFSRIMDPYATFQEIDMYLGGVLGNTENNMVEISDTRMRDKKGFDEYSFKKLPTKNR